MNPLTLAGGGIAGLSLGIALRRAGVPVILHEAASYPRHRVCGEFIAGVSDDTLRTLGVLDLLDDALTLRETRWHHGPRPVYRRPLPNPARGISRHRLDQRLAEHFTSLGGELRTRSRLPPEALNREGTVLTGGRVLDKRSPWLGLKVHLRAFQPTADLELHLAGGCYAGVSSVEDGRVNLCGLFHRRRGVKAPREGLIFAYLRACGLDALAERAEAAGPDDASHAGVSGVAFGRVAHPGSVLALGDCHSITPPFTGNGMSMAFESAATALEPLTRYARGHVDWPATRARIDSLLGRRFRTRLRAARAIHPILYQPALQPVLALAGRARLIPYARLYAMTH